MGTVAQEISSLRERISAAYDHVQAKGVVIPPSLERTSWNLSTVIEDIPTVETVNGVKNLHSYQPELVPTDGAIVTSGPVLSGTLRYGPYVADHSDISVLSSWRQILGCRYGVYGVWDPRTLSNFPYLKCRTPNVSAVNLGNLLSVNRIYALTYLANSNKNVLSINLDQLRVVSGDSAMNGFARGSNVACSLPELTHAVGSNVFSYAWSCVSAADSPQDEQFLPKLTSVVGNYALQYAFRYYEPRNHFIDLSGLVSTSG